MAQQKASPDQTCLEQAHQDQARLAQALAWGRQHGAALVRQLLAWFDTAARILPWRQVRDPYRVLLSELMLQQTQVQTVIPYYERFLQRWPTLADLAAADEEAVLKAWEGLGYYSRARHLLQAARLVAARYDGQVPVADKDLRLLPGVGDYTAGAIRSIAFGLPAAAVDGNFVRVLARLAGIDWTAADPRQRRAVRVMVEAILPAGRPGDFNEAMMDLGATICLPGEARCTSCPVADLCSAWRTGRVGELPLKTNKKASPTDELTCLAIESDGLFYVRRRGPGLLAGLYEFAWLPGCLTAEAVLAAWSLIDSHQPAITSLGRRKHVFTHRQWQMMGYRLRLPSGGPLPDLTELSGAGGRWVSVEELASLPFPTALAAWRDLILVLPPSS